MEKENVITSAVQKTGAEKENVKISAAQKTAQKKYDEKTKMLSIKYTPVDMADYEKLRVHLEESGLSANQFIKGLIHDYFDPEKKAAAPTAAAAKQTGSSEAGEGQAKQENTGAKVQTDKMSGRGMVPEWFD